MKMDRKIVGYVTVGVVSAALAGLGVTAMAGAAGSDAVARVPVVGAIAGGQHAGETLVTGSMKTTITKAVEAKYAGATVERVETDAEGNGTYEAHITKKDGTQATAYFDADGKLTSTEAGRGGPGGPGDQDQSDAAA